MSRTLSPYLSRYNGLLSRILGFRTIRILPPLKWTYKDHGRQCQHHDDAPDPFESRADEGMRAASRDFRLSLPAGLRDARLIQLPTI